MIVKAKGITILKDKESTTFKDNKVIKNLNENNFITLLNGSKVESFRLESIRNFKEGFVNAMIPKEIKLDGDAYTKREKIFDKNKVWIDTKPLVLNITSDNNSGSTLGYESKLSLKDTNTTYLVSKFKDIKLYVCFIGIIILYFLSFLFK